MFFGSYGSLRSGHVWLSYGIQPRWLRVGTHRQSPARGGKQKAQEQRTIARFFCAPAEEYMLGKGSPRHAQPQLSDVGK